MTGDEPDRGPADGHFAEGGASPGLRGEHERYPVSPELRNAVLDLEEPLTDLRSALAALDLIASGGSSIELDDMIGLRYLARQSRRLADVMLRQWRRALAEVESRPSDLSSP